MNSKDVSIVPMTKPIKKIIKETEDEYYRISPEDYLDVMRYASYNGNVFRKMKQYGGKPLYITGDLDLGGKDVKDIGEYDFTVFARAGKKVWIEEDMLAQITVGDINQDLYNTALYNQFQYQAVNAKTWADKAYVMNESFEFSAQ